MSLTTVPPAIVDIVKTANGIYDGSDPPPPKIDSAQLPFVYCLTRDGEYNWTQGGTFIGEEIREFAIQVAVLPTSLGSPDEREPRCRVLIDAVRDVLAGYPSLGGTAGVIDTTVMGATGPAILPEFGGKFIGFEMRLSVRMVFKRSFADGE